MLSKVASCADFIESCSRQNKTGQAGAVIDKGLAYTLRSLETHKLTKRARRIHIVCPDAPPDFLDLQNPKLNVV